MLSTILFSLFLEKIMLEVPHDHQTPISIGGRPICNVGIADDVYLIGGCELQDVTNRPADKGKAHEIEVSTDRSKIRTNKNTRQRTARTPH